MAKQQPMWVARDGEDDGADYCLFPVEPEWAAPTWWPLGEDDEVVVIDPAQSPVELEPGDGPVRVWLADETERAIIEAARGLVRNVKDSLDIVASSYYDDIKRLVEGEA